MPSYSVAEYIHHLMASPQLKGEVAFYRELPPDPPSFGTVSDPWPPAIRHLLEGAGIAGMYQHQCVAVRHIRSGRHVVVATPTASGKTFVYTLPILEAVLRDPCTRALYLSPFKALAQDQLRGFQRLAQACDISGPAAAVYDGDTPSHRRRRIREAPPHLILTNPEMLHLSFLPYHHKWAAWLANLKFVVVDEVHAYRGIMGSHMAQVFRRLLRICALYGAAPTFVFCSATVANPGELAGLLTGLPIEVITQSGAPRGKRHVLLIDPLAGMVKTVLQLLLQALEHGLRSIVYTQSRKLAELISLWSKSGAGPYRDRISAYRAGLLPEERREIEARLYRKELLAVISTSALELGIDIGHLDLVLLAGYPGSMMATWQRGGRAGRAGQDSALILVGGEDALDQYFLRNPEDFLRMEPERAVVNPYNPAILSRHLVCAAAEHPLAAGEPLLKPAAVKETLAGLVAGGELLKSADGGAFFARRRFPQRDVDLRGGGSRFTILDGKTEAVKGEIDGFRAFRETHPGAVYLHLGKSYQVDSLDPEAGIVKVHEQKVDYYTRVKGWKETRILEITAETRAWDTRVFAGRLRVTDQVTGYERRSVRGRRRLEVIPLDLPPQTFETQGIWFEIPGRLMEAAAAAQYHFMGGIHAIEHAAIGIFPLLVLSDRNDLGGISTPIHPQIQAPAVFIYDGIPGGAGISLQAYDRVDRLLAHTYRAISGCRCENGCPACIHSPKCGSGNRPLDKRCALFILESMQRPPEGNIQADAVHRPLPVPAPAAPAARTCRPTAAPCVFGVLDLETQRSAQDVGGWHRADRMGVSCAVLYDSRRDRYVEYLEDEVSRLVEDLQALDLVVGFNIRRFDYQVLSGYSAFDFRGLPTLDILEEVKKHLGYRLSLDHLARLTLGCAKIADGLTALKWWQEGRIRELVAYCRSDVEITRDLYLFGRKNGYLLFRNKARHTVQVPVAW